VGEVLPRMEKKFLEVQKNSYLEEDAHCQFPRVGLKTCCWMTGKEALGEQTQKKKTKNKRGDSPSRLPPGLCGSVDISGSPTGFELECGGSGKAKVGNNCTVFLIETKVAEPVLGEKVRYSIPWKTSYRKKNKEGGKREGFFAGLVFPLPNALKEVVGGRRRNGKKAVEVATPLSSVGKLQEGRAFNPKILRAVRKG